MRMPVIERSRPARKVGSSLNELVTSRKRRIVKVGSSASPACTADRAWASSPRRASTAARWKCAAEQFRFALRPRHECFSYSQFIKSSTHSLSRILPCVSGDLGFKITLGIMKAELAVREIIANSLAWNEGIDLPNAPEHRRRYGLRAQAYIDHSDLAEIEKANLLMNGESVYALI